MANFGPLIAAVAADPSRREALERDLLAFAEETAEDGPEGSVVFRFEYLLAVGRRAGGD